jgi:hypothetical protein
MKDEGHSNRLGKFVHVSFAVERYTYTHVANITPRVIMMQHHHTRII